MDKKTKQKGENCCHICNKNFARSTTLRRHIDDIHRIPGTCSECNKIFLDLKSLNQHIRTEHDQRDDSLREYCKLCDGKFSNKSNLIKHMRQVHPAENNYKSLALLKCPLCDSTFNATSKLHEHIEIDHDVPLEIVSKVFESVDEFKKWKSITEKEDLAFFTIHRVNGNRSYYGCHRSGSSRLTGTGKRLKCSHSSKIGSRCPARIVVTNIEGRITVDYCKTHVGHSKSIQFLHLTKEERDELARKIKIGMTFDQILDDIHESVVSNESIHRLHIVNKRDLYNIVRDYELDRDVVHKNDAFSTEMWLQEQMAFGEDSPFLYFKMQGCEKNDDLLKDDFMIVLMTKYQQDVLSKYAIDKVCIDSTHGTTEHDFQLTTMLTIDEFGAGCPVAFCISNRIDSVAISQFLKSVKKKMGLIPAKILMSDDDLTYINTWTKIMCKPQHHLICNWHIDRSWRNNLNKIPDPMKQSEVYKACRTLMEISDIEKFHESLESFLAMCNDDIDTHNFGAYFEKHYAHRPEQWAFCYRSDLPLNTNIFLEAMHKKLKYCYMHGNQNRRVDKCISFLMRFSRDMMFERIIRMAKNKSTFRMEQIAHSHHRSNNIEDSKIKIIDEKTWLVQSSSGPTLYSVSINDHRRCIGCPLSCPECKVCVHYYTCTCIDFKIKGNFCKHVHACVRISNKTQTYLTTNEEVTISAFESHSSSVVMGSQEQTAHLRDAVSVSSQLTTLLNAALGIASSATDEAKLKACKKIEEAIQILESNKNVPENSLIWAPFLRTT